MGPPATEAWCSAACAATHPQSCRVWWIRHMPPCSIHSACCAPIIRPSGRGGTPMGPWGGGSPIMCIPLSSSAYPPLPPSPTWGVCHDFDSRDIFRKYFCACVRTWVAFLVPTKFAICLTSLGPYNPIASTKRWCSSAVQYRVWPVSSAPCPGVGLDPWCFHTSSCSLDTSFTATCSRALSMKFSLERSASVLAVSRLTTAASAAPGPSTLRAKPPPACWTAARGEPPPIACICATSGPPSTSAAIPGTSALAL
mmetsp:Transcript_20012/g.46092  ORF Transcript_20012/g.46092 Transcript_20012/m.46092 type:complete len:254 (-) Transcript_20012:537-1298(-)